MLMPEASAMGVRMLGVKLFGKPRIYRDETAVEISLKKSEAVLYYLCYNMRATRDELIDLIWQDTDVATAKKNLRNCLYRLKKDLDAEVFLSPSKNVITLNTALVLTDRDNEDVFLETYKGRFLEGFTLGESLAFDQWVESVNGELANRYLKIGKSLIEAHLEDARALVVAQTMCAIDPFDEEAVRLHMRVYAHRDNINGVVNAYASLKARLSDELGITPDSETTNLYYDLMNIRNVPKAQSELYGRVKDLENILNNPVSSLIVGEAGVGKTALIKAALGQLETKYYIADTVCYPIESAFGLKAWDDLLYGIYVAFGERLALKEPVLQLLARSFPSFLMEVGTLQTEHFDTLNFGYVEKVVCHILNDASKSTPICLHVEDLQWMDELSLKLLTTVLLKCQRVFLIASMRNEYTNATDLMTRTLVAYKKLNIFPLERFNGVEVGELIDFLSEKPVDEALKKRIFEESEGNAFFVVEMLRLKPSQIIDQKLEDLLGARFIGLDAESEKLLNLMAPFFDYAGYEMLSQLYAGDEDMLISAIGQLKHRYLIEETLRDDEIHYQFTHQKLRVYVYDQMPVAKRRSLHRRIADAWRQRLGMPQQDIFIFQRLMYHYEAADDLKGQLTYYIKYLESYFDFSHELYPEMTALKLEAYEDQPELSFSKLNQLIRKANERNLDIESLGLKYHLMYGRYLIRQGYYDVGLKEIDHLIEGARVIQDREMLFKGYVQKIYHAIQIGDVDAMQVGIDHLEAIEPKGKHLAILVRFKGIAYMMLNQHESARAAFYDSITIFESLGAAERYRLNIAAAYNYISETYRNAGDYTASLKASENAIALCEEGKILRGLSIFNTNAGIAAYEMGDFKRAKGHFEAALESYEQIDTLWRRADAEAYMGLLCLQEGQVETAKRYAEAAVAHAHPIDNPKTADAVATLTEKMRETL